MDYSPQLYRIYIIDVVISEMEAFSNIIECIKLTEE